MRVGNAAISSAHEKRHLDLRDPSGGSRGDEYLMGRSPRCNRRLVHSGSVPPPPLNCGIRSLRPGNAAFPIDHLSEWPIVSFGIDRYKMRPFPVSALRPPQCLGSVFALVQFVVLHVFDLFVIGYKPPRLPSPGHGKIFWKVTSGVSSDECRNPRQ